MPLTTAEFLDYRSRINSAWSAKPSVPLLVHCSAGVGRTGTYISIDRSVSFLSFPFCHACKRPVSFASSVLFLTHAAAGWLPLYSILKEVDAKAPLIDIDRTVADLRRCRDGMVQTITQYLFVYRVIIEAVKLQMSKKPEPQPEEV